MMEIIKKDKYSSMILNVGGALGGLVGMGLLCKDAGTNRESPAEIIMITMATSALGIVGSIFYIAEKGLMT